MHVKLIVTPWKEDSATTPEDALALFCRGIEVDGEKLEAGKATIGSLGEFLVLEVLDISPEYFASLSKDNYTLGSSEAKTGLVITNLEVEVTSPGE
jgi:hypothetical protein